MKALTNLSKKDIFFYLILAFLLIIFFKNGFSIGFFKDDLYFLNTSRVDSFIGILNFFNPNLNLGGFRPISTQMFFFIIQFLHLNHFTIHLIMYLVFFIGLIALYQNIRLFFKNHLLAKTTVLLYTLNLNHVFQLYPTCNFQEICLFTFLNLSFYSLVKNRVLVSLAFFVLALLSKESAVFYPLLIVFIILIQSRFKLPTKLKLNNKYLLIFGSITLIFLALSQYELSRFTQNELYAIHLNPRLITNNLMWYGFWGMGLPSYLPDYLVSIFRAPLPDFYKTLATPESRFYFYPLLAYLVQLILGSFFLLSSREERKKFILISMSSLALFSVFVASTLPMIHKTPIRLTVPLVFLTFWQGYLIFRLLRNGFIGKFLAYLMILTFLIFNYFGTLVHEDASTINLESKIYFKSINYLEKRRSEILKHESIYFKDKKDSQSNPWGGSRKLYDTFWGQNFTTYFFPEKKIKAVFQFQTPIPPTNSYRVPSLELLPY